MRIMFNPIVPLMTGALILSACSDPAPKPNFLALCLGQTRVSGDYTIDETRIRQNGYPRVTVGNGGTAGQAVALEECIQTRMVAAKVPPNKLKAPPTIAGKLPYPGEYVLQPGDAKLWPTLTLAQQQRAIEFLKSGSTIRSSLDGDI
jgi:hypothetical protein